MTAYKVLESTRKQVFEGRVSTDCDAAIIGAGPYGLALGAHLKAKGMSIVVFGEPMEFWGSKMPEGMLLRSPRVASNLSDPGNVFTLEAYEQTSKIAPCAPLPLDTFVSYGRWFRHQLGENVDTRNVSSIHRDGAQFRLVLADGDEIRAKRVIVAAGIGRFKKKPIVFEALPSTHVSHCYDGRGLRKFAKQRVAVIGAGQSALESAALLHEAGAEVELIVRRPELRWIGQHKWLHRMGPISSMLYSSHDVGPAGISRLVAYPRITARLPLKLRDRIRTRAVKPGGSQWLPNRLANVKTTSGCSVLKAGIVGDEVALALDNGTERRVDHVMLGTGYRVDISAYEFLPSQLVRDIQQFDGYPKLTRGFRSSVPGLHFVGATAARSFGPLLYFVAGTEFASRELVRSL